MVCGMKYDLEIENLDFDWIKGINLSIKRGSVAVISDTEKITTVEICNIVSGLKNIPKTGKIKYFGEEKRDGRRIGLISRNVNFSSRKTVREKIVEWGKMLGVSEVNSEADVIISKLELDSIKDSVVDSLTLSEKQWVVFAAAMIFNPDILIFNHCIGSLNAHHRERFIRIIEKLNRRYNTTVLIATDFLDECLQIANRIWIINNNRLIAVEDELLDEKHRRYINIKGKPSGIMAVILEKMNLTYYVEGKDRIYIYDENEKVSDIVRTFVENGIQIEEAFEVRESVVDKIKRIMED